MACDVAAVGAAVEDVKVGARVALNPHLTCGRCEVCRQGEDSLCVRYGILGEHEPGGFAELVKVRGTNVLPLPDHVSYEEAAAFILVTLTAWRMLVTQAAVRDRKSTRLNSSHRCISYAVFCLKKKNTKLPPPNLVSVTD